jgi:hypothetical protein
MAQTQWTVTPERFSTWGRRIDNRFVGKDTLLFGPYLNLPPGSYELEVRLQAKTPVNVRLSSSEREYFRLDISGAQQLRRTFEVKKPIGDLEFTAFSPNENELILGEFIVHRL